MRVLRKVFRPIEVLLIQVRVTVCVVVGERNLLADPRATPADTELGGHGRHIGLLEAQGGGIHSPSKGLVCGVETHVENLDNVSLALE